MTIPFSKTDLAVTVILGGVPYSIPREDPRYPRVLSGLQRQSTEQELMDIVKSEIEMGRAKQEFNAEIEVVPGVSFDGRQLKLNGEPAPAYISKKATALFNEGFSLEPLANFLKRLPNSYRIRNSLLEFLDYGNLPLMEDGRFVAYKRVREDFLDIYSGTFSNAPGQILSMPRHQVDDNPNHTCSHGFHVCSYRYLVHFGSNRAHTDKVVACAVAPEDVVSIPADYSHTKMRVSRYEVLNELPVKWQKSDVLSNSSYYADDMGDSIFHVFYRDERKGGDWVLMEEFDTLEEAKKAAKEAYADDYANSYEVRNVMEDRVLLRLAGCAEDLDGAPEDDGNAYVVTARVDGYKVAWQECTTLEEAVTAAKDILQRRPLAEAEVTCPDGVTISLNN